MKRTKWATRTIKNGEVRILGVDYEPSRKFLDYDGRLDGQRWTFGLYWNGDKRKEDLVFLWGPERWGKTATEKWDWPGPACVEGRFPWDWWYPIGAQTDKKAPDYLQPWDGNEWLKSQAIEVAPYTGP